MKKLIYLLSVVFLISCNCMLSQVPPQTLYVDSNDEVTVPDYRSLVTVNDNCGNYILAQEPPANTVLSDINHLDVVITATDGSNNNSSITIDVAVVDTIVDDEFEMSLSSQTLYVDENCEVILPDYTNDVVITGTEREVNLIQSPEPGELLSFMNPFEIEITGTLGDYTTNIYVLINMYDTIAPVIKPIEDTIPPEPPVTDAYFVSTIGNDNNDGSFEHPWKTWPYAFKQLSDGDTLYIRGGTYYRANNGAVFDKITVTGTYYDPIVIMAYPGEVPILDFSNVTTNTHTECFGLVTFTYYVKFIGLTLQNLPEQDENDFINMWHMEGSHTTVDRCVVRHGGGRGFRTWEVSAFTFINCDSYDHVDHLSPSLAGNDGYGFSHYGSSSTDDTYFINCRAWNCGDDGFTSASEAHVEYIGCWSFNNGVLEGNGNGFKLNRSNTEINSAIKVVTNCIAAYNKGTGITSNDQGFYSITYEVFNNLLYHNGYHGDPYWGYGAVLFNTNSDSSYELAREFRNNISYDNEKGAIYLQSGGAYTHSNNTWDSNVTVSSNDFVALPSSMAAGIAMLSSSRQADGSLPNLGNYFQLTEGSDLIDAGINVGLPYKGNAPDVGAYESDYTGTVDPPVDPPVITEAIIADHTIVDDYNNIPQEYINEVKKMWLSYAGQSHSEGIRDGLDALEVVDSRFQVNRTESGTPESYTDDHMRVSRATWGSYYNSTGWIYNYSTYSWFVQALGISRTKAGISYCNNNNLTLGALGFGWCWDSEINLQSEFQQYINATKQYVDYCQDEDINTQVFFTTGTVDGGENTFGEIGYDRHLGFELIRDYVETNDLVLFDYADILCYNDDDELSTTSWDGNVYPKIHPDNLGGEYTGHIGMNGAIRLAKAMWWMLARVAGWDGN